MGQAEAESPASKPSPGRVLVVDDDPDVRRMLVRIIGRQHHDTTEAQNGREALKLVQEKTFELIVSDVQMPDMDGVEMLRALHELDPNLPVLLLSGAPDLNTAMKAVQYGAFEYLTNPSGRTHS
jgi:DNA-binding NtrC family response regulator